ncbi:MAG TPA: serine/threonine-protein kinase [Kofleriaceae bacterium]
MNVDDDLALAPTITDGLPPSDQLIGTTLDRRYRIVDCLAVGATSVLYRGVQLSVDRPVAIKVLRSEGARDPMTTRRFLREAQILTRLGHPNIVAALDFGHTESGELYLVLELLRGRTLEAELARIGQFDLRRTCEIAIQLCSALSAAHSVGITYRGLDPSKIMLLEDPAVRDVVKVLDLGAPDLGAPLAEVDPRSDLYSLGSVMLIMLAGTRRPGATRPLPRNVPRSIESLVLALLARDPADRPSATLVHVQLQAWLDEHAAGPSLASDQRPTLQEIPRVRRVLPPTPLVAQPMPAFMPVDTPATAFAQPPVPRAIIAAALLILFGASLLLTILLI